MRIGGTLSDIIIEIQIANKDYNENEFCINCLRLSHATDGIVLVDIEMFYKI